MFLDIRDFTRFSEFHSPEEVVTYLNSLFEFMIEIVNKHHGIINKFLGDGFMAVFGVPYTKENDVQNCVHAAQEILRKIEEKEKASQIMPTRIGIGIHTGQAVTGNVGSNIRKEYTVIGDVVNLASRIEKMNKQFQSQLLISEDVRMSMATDSISTKSLGIVPIRGHQKPIHIHQIC